MIRKWSYIINNLGNSKFSKLNIKSENPKYLLFFKIFRKNTRFKCTKYSIITDFKRKAVILIKRRLGWNKYFFLSILWVQNSTTNKKLINFLQCKSIFKFINNYTYISILKKQSKFLNPWEFYNQPVNYTFLKNNIFKFFLTKISLNTFKNKTTKNKNIINVMYFNSLSYKNKLLNLGFLLKKDIKYSFFNKNFSLISMYSSLLSNLSINITVVLGSIHIYITLYQTQSKLNK